jgi:hypothetical protein
MVERVRRSGVVLSVTWTRDDRFAGRPSFIDRRRCGERSVPGGCRGVAVVPPLERLADERPWLLVGRAFSVFVALHAFVVEVVDRRAVFG